MPCVLPFFRVLVPVHERTSANAIVAIRYSYGILQITPISSPSYTLNPEFRAPILRPFHPETIEKKGKMWSSSK